MSEVLEIKLENLDKIVEAFVRFPRTVASNLQAAGREAGAHVIGQEGLQKYPGDTTREAQPFKTEKARRYFFWALRNGMIEVPYRRGQSPNSERYGTQFVINAQPYTTSIGNRATYASLLGGSNQSAYMAKRGWRKLYDVAKQQLGAITKIYQDWVNKTIREVGL